MNSYKLTILVAAVLLLLAVTGFADDDQDGANLDVKAPSATESASAVTQTRTGEQIKWQVISSGGTKASSASFGLQGTVAQTAVGGGTSDNYGLTHGFWQESGGGGGTCCMGPIRGNVDYDVGDAIDISDLVYLVDYMFTGGSAPTCWEEANVDGSGDGPPDGSEDIDISDLVYLVDFMFNGGPAPLPCP